MAWYDTIDVDSTDTSVSDGDGHCDRMNVSCGAAGSCTKLRVGIRDSFFAANLKMALYDSSNNLLEQGSATGVNIGTAPDWVEITLDAPVSVSATTYKIGFSASNTGQQLGYLASAGSSLYDAGVSHASFPTDPWSTADNVSRTLALGMWVDESGGGVVIPIIVHHLRQQGIA
jgi:hypothetical protein